MSPRETRVVALNNPSDRENAGWYFQRWVPHLPVAEEFVLFNRSWYNRAGVEPVMGFCTPGEHAAFLQSVPQFEGLLVQSGIQLLKSYLAVSHGEQARRGGGCGGIADLGRAADRHGSHRAQRQRLHHRGHRRQ